MLGEPRLHFEVTFDDFAPLYIQCLRIGHAFGKDFQCREWFHSYCFGECETFCESGTV